jgi:hypothetical protein
LPSVGRRQLRQYARGQTEIDADGKDVAAANPAARADDQLLRLERRHDRLHEGIGGGPAAIDDRIAPVPTPISTTRSAGVKPSIWTRTEAML